jgi:hypothetical protein
VSERAGPASLAAERAVRVLRTRGRSVGSLDLAREVLATRSTSEPIATRVLEAAFGGDRRLRYADGAWALAEPMAGRAAPARVRDADRVFLAPTIERSGRTPHLVAVSAARMRGRRIVGACSGRAEGPASARLRAELTRLLEGAVPVLHDTRGSIGALERWLGRALAAPVSLRELARDRFGLRASHGLGALMGRLGIRWRDTDEPRDVAAALDAALRALRRRGEPLQELRVRHDAARAPVDLARFAFDEAFLRSVPHAPGTYRFYDLEGRLTYVGKSANLARRLASYFHTRPSPRVRRLLDTLWRIDYRPAGSDLEAMLREAAQIRRDRPASNVVREVHVRGRRLSLDSLLIVEPAEPPAVLRAFLVRTGRLVGRVAIGRRGGGLARLERLLDERSFSTEPEAAGVDLDGELVARWLSMHERVVAFDPTDLPSASEVVDRLRTLARRQVLVDAEGPPRYR